MTIWEIYLLGVITNMVLSLTVGIILSIFYIRVNGVFEHAVHNQRLMAHIENRSTKAKMYSLLRVLIPFCEILGSSYLVYLSIKNNFDSKDCVDAIIQYDKEILGE